MGNSRNTKRLRMGFTTGSCATAAAKGALHCLLGNRLKKVEISLPPGGIATIPLAHCWCQQGKGYGIVVKDAGDDPDVTHGALIGAQVSIRTVKKTQLQGTPRIILKGGEGIGVVTKPGLPVKKGESAINPVPRQMIRGSVREVFTLQALYSPLVQRVEVVVFAPGGMELANKTLNPRLGILGGISILGTSGIVKPFSHQAYKETIRCALRIAKATGCKEVVFSTGGMSEKLAKAYFPHLPQESFIQIGDYLGFALTQVLTEGFSRVTLAAFMGKLSKIAAGCTNTHVQSAPLQIQFLLALGKRAGVAEVVLREVAHALTARGVLDVVLKYRVFRFIDMLCIQAIEKMDVLCKGKASIFLILFSFDSEVLWYGSSEGKIAGISW